MSLNSTRRSHSRLTGRSPSSPAPKSSSEISTAESSNYIILALRWLMGTNLFSKCTATENTLTVITSYYSMSVWDCAWGKRSQWNSFWHKFPRTTWLNSRLCSNHHLWLPGTPSRSARMSTLAMWRITIPTFGTRLCRSCNSAGNSRSNCPICSREKLISAMLTRLNSNFRTKNS